MEVAKVSKYAAEEAHVWVFLTLGDVDTQTLQLGVECGAARDGARRRAAMKGVEQLGLEIVKLLRRRCD